MKTEGEMSELDKATEKRAQENVEMIRAYKETFKSPKGQKVLQDLMITCGVLVTERSPLEANVHYREGRRSVFMDIMQLLGKNEEDILKILQKQSVYEEDDL